MPPIQWKSEADVGDEAIASLGPWSHLHHFLQAVMKYRWVASWQGALGASLF